MSDAHWATCSIYRLTCIRFEKESHCTFWFFSCLVLIFSAIIRHQWVLVVAGVARHQNNHWYLTMLDIQVDKMLKKKKKSISDFKPKDDRFALEPGRMAGPVHGRPEDYSLRQLEEKWHLPWRRPQEESRTSQISTSNQQQCCRTITCIYGATGSKLLSMETIYKKIFF